MHFVCISVLAGYVLPGNSCPRCFWRIHATISSIRSSSLPPVQSQVMPCVHSKFFQYKLFFFMLFLCFFLCFLLDEL
ncbi:unnamed protein product [Gongylonema pulchrum]|uniref:Secreted protein n=1 Tax=Gongylonema pulchrum TaxID=637853 RepID=A0A183DXB9_9BILA|nr:unnamed protein product [Gongylonema pulchrum]